MANVAQYVQQFEADISKLKDASKYIVDIYDSEQIYRMDRMQYVYSEKTIAATAVAIKHIDKIKTIVARKLVAQFAARDVKYRLRSVTDDLFDEAVDATRNIDVLFLFAVRRWDYVESYGKILNKYYPQVTDQQHSNFFWAVFHKTRWRLIFDRPLSFLEVSRSRVSLAVEDNLDYPVYLTDFSEVSIKDIFSYFSGRGCSNSVAAHLVVLWLATHPGKNLSQTDLDWLRAYIDDPVIFGDPSYSVSDLINSIDTRNIPLLASAGIFDEDVLIRYYERFSDDDNEWRAIFDDQDSSVLRLIGSAMVHILNDEPLTPEEKGALWFYRYSDLYPENVRKSIPDKQLFESIPIHLLSVAGGVDVLRKVMDSFTAPIEIPDGLYSNVDDKEHLITTVAIVNEVGSTKIMHAVNVYRSLYKVIA